MIFLQIKAYLDFFFLEFILHSEAEEKNAYFSIKAWELKANNTSTINKKGGRTREKLLNADANFNKRSLFALSKVTKLPV